MTARVSQAAQALLSILGPVEPNLSTKELKAVLALSQTRSFGQAALQMHLSQSALSALIARVETHIGARLFERTTRAVELTDAGQIFVSHAQELVRDTQRAVQAVADAVQLKTGAVSVAALPSLAASTVPEVFAIFSQIHPGVRLSLLDTLSGPAFDLVRSGKVDLALTAADPKQEDLAYEQLTTDEFVLICPIGHPLCDHQQPIALHETLQYPHISMSASASVRQYLDAELLQQGHTFTPAFEVDHIATIGALVTHGLGISALPETAVSLLKSEAIHYLPLQAPGIQRPLGVVTRRHAPLSYAAQALIKLIKQALAHSATASNASR